MSVNRKDLSPSEVAYLDYMQGWTDGTSVDGATSNSLHEETAMYRRGYDDGRRMKSIAESTAHGYVFYEVEGHCRWCLGKGLETHFPPKSCTNCNGSGYEPRPVKP
jgi:hypothetical protein